MSVSGPLSLSDAMENGQDYTFSIKTNATLFPLTLQDIQAALLQLQDIGGATVTEDVGGLLSAVSFSGRTWDIGFTFMGDDSVATIGSVADEINGAVSSVHWLVSSQLAQATKDLGTGLVATGQSDAAGQPGNQGGAVSTDVGKLATYAVIGAVVIVGLVVVLKVA